VRTERTNRRRVAWGVILITLGAFLLLLQLGTFNWVHWGVWWPAILVVIGVVRIAAPEHPRHIASGVTMILLGLWFFACTNHWYELTYRRAWPLLLVIFGFEIVIKAVLERLGPAREEEERHA
jgi:membrane-bound ClpP family serine protease